MIAEIIGLAGAGKSSLRRALQQEGTPTFTRGLSIRNPQNLPYFAATSLRVLPTLVQLPWYGRWYSRVEIARLFYLSGMSQVFQQKTRRGQPLFVDQGPIFELATLYAFGPDRLHAQSHMVWWHKMFEQWAATLELIVWLDAPAETLVQRIQGREKWHSIKESSLGEMQEYLGRYQAAYAHVVAEIRVRGNIEVLSFDTSNHATEAIVSDILHMLNRPAEKEERPPLAPPDIERGDIERADIERDAGTTTPPPGRIKVRE